MKISSLRDGIFIFVIMLTFMPLGGLAQEKIKEDQAGFIYGDPLPNAPELAKRGGFSVGVRTVTIKHPNQRDLLNYTKENQNARYDRPLTLEIWYPALIPAGKSEMASYHDFLKNKTKFTIKGRALRNASPDRSASESPLVIISHGYPGSRVLLAYLGENLASKGYVVASIDHTDSTHQDQNKFGSTLLNRSFDQRFTLDKMAEMSKDKHSFLYQMLNADKTAIIGYSMGGYGALNSAGAGYSARFVDVASTAGLVPDNQLAVHQTGNEAYLASLDPRLKAIVAFAPWGGEAALTAVGFPKGLSIWDNQGLSGIKIPSLFIVGNEDDVSFYEGGVKTLYEGAVNSDRYLLVYNNAQHNVAPHPPPPEAVEDKDYDHYAEPAWSLERLNNLNQHFVAAFLGIHLKGKKYEGFLNVISHSNDGKWSQKEDGNFKEDHTYWKGFRKRTAVGMQMHHASPK